MLAESDIEFSVPAGEDLACCTDLSQSIRAQLDS